MDWAALKDHLHKHDQLSLLEKAVENANVIVIEVRYTSLNSAVRSVVWSHESVNFDELMSIRGVKMVRLDHSHGFPICEARYP